MRLICAIVILSSQWLFGSLCVEGDGDTFCPPARFSDANYFMIFGKADPHLVDEYLAPKGLKSVVAKGKFGNKAIMGLTYMEYRNSDFKNFKEVSVIFLAQRIDDNFSFSGILSLSQIWTAQQHIAQYGLYYDRMILDGDGAKAALEMGRKLGFPKEYGKVSYQSSFTRRSYEVTGADFSLKVNLKHFFGVGTAFNPETFLILKDDRHDEPCWMNLQGRSKHISESFGLFTANDSIEMTGTLEDFFSSFEFSPYSWTYVKGMEGYFSWSSPSCVIE